MGSGEWVVNIDHKGRVVASAAEGAVAASYLVLPNPDGSLDLLERDHRRSPSPEQVSAHTQPDDLAEAEMARWEAVADAADRRLAEQRPGPSTTASGRGIGPVIDLSPKDAPQPQAFSSSDREANFPTMSVVDSALKYWLIQNRDAHVLFQQRGTSSRSRVHPAPASASASAASASSSPVAGSPAL